MRRRRKLWRSHLGAPRLIYIRRTWEEEEEPPSRPAGGTVVCSLLLRVHGDPSHRGKGEGGAVWTHGSGWGGVVLNGCVVS